MPTKEQFLVFVGWLGFLCLAIMFFYGWTVVYKDYIKTIRGTGKSVTSPLELETARR